MSFAHASWLWALVGLLVLGLWLGRAERRRRADLARLGEPGLLAGLTLGLDPAGRARRRRYRLMALALLTLALARPQWGTSTEQVERSGRQVMLVLDVSASMLTADLSPSRLERARLEIQALLDRISGDEAGLVLFSGAAFTQVPLTVDHSMLLGLLELARPQIISRPGTSIGAAIDSALAGFDESRLDDRAIVIFSDGEDPEPGAIEAAKRAADAGAVIFTVGLGTTEGARIPDTNEAGQQLSRMTAGGTVEPAWILDDAGREVVSHLDETVLREIAAVSGGDYVRAGGVGSAAAALATDLDRLARGELAGSLGA
ncbi:MAG: VWA domain-containing protein, partial [Chloroflexi bacterium]|nr:VWA domain-containing protein [Chloroflexota bacterium]